MPPLTVETSRTADGRWVASIPQLPGVQADGPTRLEAIQRVEAHALRVMAERVENGEAVPGLRHLIHEPDEPPSDSDDLRRMAEAGLRLAADVWGAEDFSDWGRIATLGAARMDDVCRAIHFAFDLPF